MAGVPSRSWRRLAALVVVLCACLPFLLAADRVNVTVDGVETQVRTYDDTVADVLARAGVELGPHDVVSPDPSTLVGDGIEVRVRRAREYSLMVDGEPRTVVTVGRRVADVLAAAGVVDVDPAHVTPAMDTLLKADMIVRVLELLAVVVVVDGREIPLELPPGTVADALAAADVTLDADDVVAPLATAELEDGQRIVVTRRAADELVVEEEIPFQSREVGTDDLLVGESVVDTEGVPGLRRDVYRLDLVEGVELGRELVSSEVVREPVDRVVLVGTREPAPPPPPPAPAPAAETGPPPEGDDIWYALADCESGGRWSLDSTYDGGLQFHPDTWNRWKLEGYPDFAYQATPGQQIAVGKRLQAARGWHPWPGCARKLGLL